MEYMDNTVHYTTEEGQVPDMTWTYVQTWVHAVIQCSNTRRWS